MCGTQRRPTTVINEPGGRPPGGIGGGLVGARCCLSGGTLPGVGLGCLPEPVGWRDLSSSDPDSPLPEVSFVGSLLGDSSGSVSSGILVAPSSASGALVDPDPSTILVESVGPKSVGLEPVSMEFVGLELVGPEPVSGELIGPEPVGLEAVGLDGVVCVGLSSTPAEPVGLDSVLVPVSVDMLDSDSSMVDSSSWLKEDSLIDDSSLSSVLNDDSLSEDSVSDDSSSSLDSVDSDVVSESSSVLPLLLASISTVRIVILATTSCRIVRTLILLSISP